MEEALDEASLAGALQETFQGEVGSELEDAPPRDQERRGTDASGEPEPESPALQVSVGARPVIAAPMMIPLERFRIPFNRGVGPWGRGLWQFELERYVTGVLFPIEPSEGTRLEIDPDVEPLRVRAERLHRSLSDTREWSWMDHYGRCREGEPPWS